MPCAERHLVKMLGKASLMNEGDGQRWSLILTPQLQMLVLYHHPFSCLPIVNILLLMILFDVFGCFNLSVCFLSGQLADKGEFIFSDFLPVHKQVVSASKPQASSHLCTPKCWGYRCSQPRLIYLFIMMMIVFLMWAPGIGIQAPPHLCSNRSHPLNSLYSPGISSL